MHRSYFLSGTVVLASLQLFFLSCAQRSSESTVQHEFGKTRLDTGTFSPCKEPRDVVGHRKTLAYLQDLKNFIVSANPDTFKGQLSPSNLCVNLSLQDLGVSGGAFGENGDIFLERLTIKESTSDADLASVMCHELAHVAVSHRTRTVTAGDGKTFRFENGMGAERYFPKVTKDSRYIRAKQRMDNLRIRLREIEKSIETLEKRSNKLMVSVLTPATVAKVREDVSAAKQAFETLNTCTGAVCQEIRSNWKKMDAMNLEVERIRHHDLLEMDFELYRTVESLVPKDVFVTWQEREADEVGLEFCARAGFDHKTLTNWHVRRLKNSESAPGLQGYTQCRSAIDKTMMRIEADKSDPFLRSTDIELLSEKGSQHPQTCWRLFNLERELKFHAGNYKSFSKGIIETLPGKLAEVKAEIRAMQELKEQTDPPKK